MFNEKEDLRKRIFPLKLTQVAKKATEALRENHHLREEKNFEKRKEIRKLNKRKFTKRSLKEGLRRRHHDKGAPVVLVG